MNRKSLDRAYACHSLLAVVASALGWLDINYRLGRMDFTHYQGWGTLIGLWGILPITISLIGVAYYSIKAAALSFQKKLTDTRLLVLAALPVVFLILAGFAGTLPTALIYAPLALYIVAAVVLSTRWFLFARKQFPEG